MVDSKHQWKAWVYLLPAIILLLIFTVYPIINTVVTAFIYNVEYKPASILVERVEDAEDKFYFYYKDEETDERRYLSAITADDGSVRLGYLNEMPDSEGGSAFEYDGSLTAWTVTVGDEQYFVGATKDTGADLFKVNEENSAELGRTIYPANLILNGKIVTVPEESKETTKTETGSESDSATASETETETETESESDTETNTGAASGNTGSSQSGSSKVNAYQFGVFKGTPQAKQYVVGVGEDGFLDTTDDFDVASKFYADGNQTSGYKLYLDDDNNYKPEAYLNVVIEDGEAFMEYSPTDGTTFKYDKTRKAWVCSVDGKDYYLSINLINRVNIHPLEEIGAETSPSPAALYVDKSGIVKEIIEEGEYKIWPDEDYYCIGTHRAADADGEQFYITTGVSETNGLMLTEDIREGETFRKFGINNFVRVLTSKGSDFMTCLLNTFILTITTVPLSTVLALLIAVGLNSIKPLQRLLQTIFFLPYVTNSIAIGMVFAAMFNIVGINSAQESVGIINNVLGIFGIERINWINQGAPAWASFTAIIIYIVWNALPFKILILLGGLQSINKQYYDAAKIDSTPKWRVLTRITVPLLSPMLTYTIITSFIGGFKEYSSVVGIFGDSRRVPGGANMNTIVGHIQDHLEITQDYGLAGAAALMLFVIIFIVTMINLRISKKSTHY